MNSLAFSAAPFDIENMENMNKNKIEQKKNARKTIRRKPTEHIAEARKQLLGFTGMDDESSDMADFNPPPKPMSVGAMRVESRNSMNEDKDNYPVQPISTMINNDSPVTQEAFHNLPSQNAEDYYKQFVPYYDKAGNGQTINQDELTNKLDYLITLLEEQQDIKTGHVTEEIILYSFLGIFIIFVLDSFARAGRYVR